MTIRCLYAADGFAQDDTESQTDFVCNASGDPAVSPSTDPGGVDEPFKADWIEVTNLGAEVLLANPFGPMSAGRSGVVVREGETFRFEWGPENEQAKTKGGFASIWLLSSATGTTVQLNAGAE